MSNPPILSKEEVLKDISKNKGLVPDKISTLKDQERIRKEKEGKGPIGVSPEVRGIADRSKEPQVEQELENDDALHYPSDEPYQTGR